MVKKNSLERGTEVVFADGEARLIKPLTIRQLRSFINIQKKLTVEDTDLNEEQIDLMIEAASIVFKTVNPDITNEELEDLLDMRSFNDMFAAAMGADPNG